MPADLQWPDAPTAGEVLERIRRESRDEPEKGRWFENLFRRLILDDKSFDVDKAWRWESWPGREERGLPTKDIGIDLVAKLNGGELVAIQCKCYDEKDRVDRAEVDKLLGASGSYDMRWFVATCDWNKNAEDRLNQSGGPPVRRIDFHEYDHARITDGRIKSEKRDPWEHQKKAVNDVVTRMKDADRGQMIMACGTGKTVASLRIAEEMLPENGRILFLAPSIALVSQARREWLRNAETRLDSLVVCSDRGAGGRGEDEDIHISELECRVTTDPGEIAAALKAGSARVIFCTYQSLDKVSEAQLRHGAPEFDLAVSDEAHRTTGVENDSKFRMVHNESKLRCKKRLYMTATQRIYEDSSKKAQEAKGRRVYDMEDEDTFGEVMHRLTFKAAVEAKRLSDYRVVIMDAPATDVKSLYDRYVSLDTANDEQKRRIKFEDIERLVGTALAINGITKRGDMERLPRVLGFANSRVRSQEFADMLNMPDLHNILRSRMGGGFVKMHEAIHLDATSPVTRRNKELRRLEDATAEEPRIICNVRLFTEGVDVPSLDAVSFLDPRESKVDVVQAVGRVMRRAAGKETGYIIIPVNLEVDDNGDVAGQLIDREGWKSIGRVLRALASHDSRMLETPYRFVEIPPAISQTFQPEHMITGFQDRLDIEGVTQKFFAKVVAGSGLAKPGEMAAEGIKAAVNRVGHRLESEGLAERLAGTLGLKISAEEYSEAHICKIAALLVFNACLLHRRLQDVPHVDGIAPLGDMLGSGDPKRALRGSWRAILESDYAPVFEPAMAIMESLPGDARRVKESIYRLVDHANVAADRLTELGYDHSGPLYHTILGTARSDSANYTDNVSALMLARLAFSGGFEFDTEHVKRLRIMDPACGTGTLLMAALKTIKDRMNYRAMDAGSRDEIHRKLVEDVLCGLDINRHAVQLAACNLTLGAPTVDYSRMHLYTMRHGPQDDGTVKAGSVEILRATGRGDSIRPFVQPLRSIGDLRGEHVDSAVEITFPISGLDMVIMNPPFGSNTARNRKYPANAVKRMQKNELTIRAELGRRDVAAGKTIDSNSIRTFFTPLADRLLNPSHGTLAEVLPVTACISSSGLEERKFLADRFQVERIITSHDPRRVNFSYKTGIHECLMVCRRREDGDRPPTEFISLRKMPKNAKEAIEAADAIADGDAEDWGSRCWWPAERVGAGDWTPVQWYNGNMAETIKELEASPLLEPVGLRYTIGPAGRRIRDAYKVGGQGGSGTVKIFHSVSANLRKTVHGEPESWHTPRQGKRQLAERYWRQRSGLLVAQRFDTISGRLAALYSDEPSIGSGWVPVNTKDEHTAKALAVWWNSTPARMMLLNRRSKKLTYPQWSLEHLEEILIPKPDNPGWSALYGAYGEICDKELLPMGRAAEDPARAVIDGAAAKVLNADPEVLAGWRERLSREPTMQKAGQQ